MFVYCVKPPRAQQAEPRGNEVRQAGNFVTLNPTHPDFQVPCLSLIEG